MAIKRGLYLYVKDHLEHFGFFPYDYEDRKTEKVVEYPEYMKYFNKKQTRELGDIFNNHEKWN